MRQIWIKITVGILFLFIGIYLGKNSLHLLPTPGTGTGMNPVSVTPSVTGPQSVTGMILVKVTRVVDGDTIEIEGGQKIRYIGIDTPEIVKPNSPVECFGKQASDKNKELVLGKNVSLEKDISETDKYGRLLRYVRVGDIFVNDYLVRNGYAHASTFPPDVRYQSQLISAQKEAQENQRGLWTPNACSQSSIPITYELQPTTSSCQIKGNINSAGEKIYHIPGQRYWDKTQIDEGAGERWFCTEKEAESSGWRKSKV